MSRLLGKRQLDLLANFVARRAFVVTDDMTRSLCRRGLMREARPGSFVHITPDGLRALAQAADDGLVELFTMPVKASAANAVGTPEGVNQRKAP